MLVSLSSAPVGSSASRMSGFVHQRAGNGYALHLPAGHLAGVLVQLVAQPYLLQRSGGTAAALGLGYARDGQCQFHVAQHGLVGDQVIALEHKTDGVVSVRVPVAVGVFFGGDAVDDQIAAVVAIQTADDVQQGGLAGAAGPRMATNSLSRRFRLTLFSACCTSSPVLYSLLICLSLSINVPFRYCAAGRCCLWFEIRKCLQTISY